MPPWAIDETGGPDSSSTEEVIIMTDQEPRTSRTATQRPSGGELARRVAVLIFGLIQIVIGLRIVLLLLDARTGNALVSGILDLSTGVRPAA
jgi:hypothetical protein